MTEGRNTRSACGGLPPGVAGWKPVSATLDLPSGGAIRPGVKCCRAANVAVTKLGEALKAAPS